MKQMPLKAGLILCVCAAALLAMPGCSSMARPEGKPVAQMSFAHIQPMGVNVRVVQPPGGQDSYIGGDFAVSPYAAAQSYLARRFRADGVSNSLRLQIVTADVKKSHQKQKQAVANFFNVAGHNVYNVTLTLRLEHVADDGRVIYGKSVTARRTMNIDEHASIAEREAHQMSGMEAMFAEMDKAIIGIVRDEMRLGF